MTRWVYNSSDFGIEGGIGNTNWKKTSMIHQRKYFTVDGLPDFDDLVWLNEIYEKFQFLLQRHCEMMRIERRPDGLTELMDEPM